ncbi:DUF1566 domain-containing protein [Methylomicrobium lacus]|uniref:DUF1566 domain-containing protein n=1 Tax=Methylomicrobium lacus TaxID=136992 RepID=UPI0035A891E1
MYVLGDTGPNGRIVYFVEGSGEHGLEARAADEPHGLNWFEVKTAASAYGPGWHLPTKTELELLYEQRNIVGMGTDGYWSSTIASNNNAWAQNFFTGTQVISSKLFTWSARAVRAF